MKTNTNETIIADIIGVPSLLEQCAEECTELAHACLQAARKQRMVNFTPKSYDELSANIHEETADVLLCLEELMNAGVISPEGIDSEKMYKRNRWIDRLNTETELEKSFRAINDVCDDIQKTFESMFSPKQSESEKINDAYDDIQKAFKAMNLPKQSESEKINDAYDDIQKAFKSMNPPKQSESEKINDAYDDIQKAFKSMNPPKQSESENIIETMKELSKRLDEWL